jgi:hypothetical protein
MRRITKKNFSIPSARDCQKEYSATAPANLFIKENIMSHFFSAQFWFNQRPDLLSSGSKTALIGFVVFCLISLIIAIFFRLKKGFYSRFWGKLISFFISNALIGAVLFFFCQQLIPLLSSRFWFLLWAAGIIFWIVLIALYAKKFPAKKKELDKERELKKYIP